MPLPALRLTILTWLLLLSAPVRAFTLQDSPKLLVDQVWQIVNDEYVDARFNQQNWTAVRRELLTRSYGTPEEAYSVLRSVLQRLGDPYTRFLSPEQFEQLNGRTNGNITGVGLTLSTDPEERRPVVVRVQPTSPAQVAELQLGDRLLTVDGKSTRELPVEDVQQLLEGEPGTAVVLKLERERRIFEVSLIRRVVEVPSVSFRMMRQGANNLGYLRLDEFSQRSATEMRKAVETLEGQGAQGFLLDLRGNPGGLLEASIDIARLWLDRGVIVRTVPRNGRSDSIRANGTAITRLPLVLLVDQYSASSSEVLAGALKDNRRAVVVGTQTFGKALVQSVHRLTGGAGVAVTVAHYYTPNGTDLGNRGIRPDRDIYLSRQDKLRYRFLPDIYGSAQDFVLYEGLATLGQQLAVRP